MVTVASSGGLGFSASGSENRNWQLAASKSLGRMSELNENKYLKLIWGNEWTVVISAG